MTRTRGSTPVPTSLLTVLLSWRSEHTVHAHALLLSAEGRVRSSRDAVFFNAPRHPSQAVTLDQEPQPGTARLSVSLPRTEAEVARILVGGSLDGDLAEVPGLTVSVEDAAGLVARADVAAPAGVRAMVFGEFERRDGHWWFSGGGTGRAGLAELFEEFGVAADRQLSLHRSTVDDRIGEIWPPPAEPDRADWHPDPGGAPVLRWWDGAEWTDSTAPPPPSDSRACARCGRRRGWRVLGAAAPCRACTGEIEEYLRGWRARAWRVLTGDGPRSPAWDDLWTALRYRRVEVDTGRAALRAPGLAWLERLTAFAGADGEVTAEVVDDFEAAVDSLRLTGPLVDELRHRLRRGHALARLRAGELPLVRAADLHLDPEEQVHVDVPAVRIRQLARGPKRTAGRLICSNKKMRFVGPEAGVELPWSRIVSVAAGAGTVSISATSARGGAEFEVPDPEVVAAAMEGALRVAKRLALAPGRRDRRSIPPEIKAEVWQRDGGRCGECGATHYLEFDHVIPLSRGGATSAANLQILCRSCNRTKGSRI
ncbi:TerD family protein [Nocardia blacklockiae]|uniref:TerD family protein n=1 Tax=Nocardia blacklockiae TaxID=480036 RepID=UPI00189426EA|nr:TerD family protein [Nocardia blacklockiae]MBF6175271.1 TerD family protein [Nocardia blacklockiae]